MASVNLRVPVVYFFARISRLCPQTKISNFFSKNFMVGGLLSPWQTKRLERILEINIWAKHTFSDLPRADTISCRARLKKSISATADDDELFPVQASLCHGRTKWKFRLVRTLFKKHLRCCRGETCSEMTRYDFF